MARPRIAIIGAGPAGLAAAEQLAGRGYAVTVYERMPAPARKFLLAGRGGLNLTHSEPLDRLLDRYGETRGLVEAAVAAHPPSVVTAWCASLGQETFVGSSGRVFPRSLKASPLLRAWLQRLAGAGVVLERRMRWTGFGAEGALRFVDAEGEERLVTADATLLALGGASWPRLGSDGSWIEILAAEGVPIAPLAPSNAGVKIGWSGVFAARFAGAPLKRIALSAGNSRVRGEAIVTRGGLEGGAVYAIGTAIRRALADAGGAPASIVVDLRPDSDIASLERRLGTARGRQTATSHLRKTLSLSPVDISLLREAAGRELPTDPSALARLVKSVRLEVTGLAGLERAISTAGGIKAEAVDERFMLKMRPGVFAAGEMLDWDAPTGGYLLQATLSTAVAAAHGIEAWLAAKARA